LAGFFDNPAGFSGLFLAISGAFAYTRAFKRLRSRDILLEECAWCAGPASQNGDGCPPRSAPPPNIRTGHGSLRASPDRAPGHQRAAGGRGKVEKQEYWGLRGLAYRIKKNRKGHYVLLNINAPSKAVFELERQLKINEDVLRYLTVKVDAFDTSSSKSRRDETKTEGENTEESVQ
jgi:small subunit ribosomal protein S6